MLSYGFNTKALWQLEPKLWAIMWFWRHLWRHCDVQWRRTAEKNIFLESVGQDLSFGILLDMVAKSSIFLNTLTLTELFEVKVKGQGQGHNRSSLIHAIIWNQHEGSTTIRTGVMAIYVILTSFMTSFWRPVTSYGKKKYISEISGPRPLIWYTTRYGWTKIEFFELFDLARPHSRSRSKVKVKVTFEAP